MNKKNIVIVAGGKLDEEILPSIGKARYIIGVDRGASWLLSNGIVPQVAIGDFDSVNPKEFSQIRKRVKDVIRYPAKKDATDLELAVEYAITLSPKEVDIFGVIGTRFDHVWAGIVLLQRLESHNIKGQIVDNFNKINIVRRLTTLKQIKSHPYVSLFPLTRKSTVTLTGFKYNIAEKVLIHGSTLAVSNEIIARVATITVHDGQVLLIRSRD